MDSKVIKSEIDFLFNPDISKAQSEFLRLTLLEHMQNYGRNNYSQLKRDIVELCSESIDSRNLSDFANNTNRKNKGKNFYSSANTKKCIALLLIEYDYISIAELSNANNIDTQIPLRLTQDLFKNAQGCDQYNGMYKYIDDTNNRCGLVKYIKLFSDSGKPFLHATEIIKKYDVRLVGRKIIFNKVLQERRLLGWAVFFQDEMLLVVIKDQLHAKSHCYISLSKPNRTEETNRVTEMLFMMHDTLDIYNFENSNSQTDIPYAEKISKKIIKLQRVDDFSGKISINEGILMDSEDDEVKAARLRRYKKSSQKRNTRSSAARKRADDLGQEEKLKERKNIMDDYMGKQLIEAVDNMDSDEVRRLVEIDPEIVNYKIPESNVTAYQISADCNDWPSLEIMLDTGKCNLLHRDDRGWLTSRFAGSHGNMELCSKLMDMEKELGKKDGIVPLVKGDLTIEEYEKLQGSIKQKQAGIHNQSNDDKSPVEP